MGAELLACESGAKKTCGSSYGESGWQIHLKCVLISEKWMKMDERGSAEINWDEAFCSGFFRCRPHLTTQIGVVGDGRKNNISDHQRACIRFSTADIDVKNKIQT
jgi:hypothetical protein